MEDAPLTSATLHATSGWASAPSSMTQQPGLLNSEQVQPNNLYISGNARVHVGNNVWAANTPHNKAVADNLINTLRFPQMHERGAQVKTASPSTYSWMLRSHPSTLNPWSCFYTWLIDPNPGRHLYWISGKPGSGKSTVMKFLQDELTLPHTTFWRQDRPVLVCHHFFWSSGTTLQKSLSGLYRSLLVQVLQRQPSIVGVLTRLGGDVKDHYSSPLYLEEVRKELLTSIKSISTEFIVLILVDGLDECSCDDDYEELFEVLDLLCGIDNVKLCCSSRPWNVFQDAFGDDPRLRLEDLTHADIKTFVESRLDTNRRWRRIISEDQDKDFGVVENITSRAQGVFLWVSLVVRDVMKYLRDGDSLEEILKKLALIPDDLNAYFRRIIESIEPAHRNETSKLLQLALFEETRYASVIGFNLVDTHFISEKHENFILTVPYKNYSIDIASEAKRDLFEDALRRKLNSRCKGLLEAYAEEDWQSLSEGSNKLYPLFTYRVEFLHRSLRDYLLLPETKGLLSEDTDGKLIDARTYFVNSWIVQLESLLELKQSLDALKFFASHIVSALSVIANTPESVMLAGRFQVSVERLTSQFLRGIRRDGESALYIDRSLSRWELEQSNFLSFAIDFRLNSYVCEVLTPEAIRSKLGRQYMDHIVCPRGLNSIDHFTPYPDIDLLTISLARGADPNESTFKSGHDRTSHQYLYQYHKSWDFNFILSSKRGEPSIWAHFLCYAADLMSSDPLTREGFLSAVRVLIRAGAARIIPVVWLLGRGYSDVKQAFQAPPASLSDLMGSVIFRRRWPIVTSQCFRYNEQVREWEVRVSALISCIFRDYSSSDAETLVAEVEALEREEGWEESIEAAGRY